MSAECYLSNLAEPLTGGRDFFESLVRVVSSYAQEFMSGVHYPDRHDHDSGLVLLHRIDGNTHRLTILPASSDSGVQIDKKTQVSAEVDLTTVQLFDLVEAIDQFFADTQTLPELSLPGFTGDNRGVEFSFGCDGVFLGAGAGSPAPQRSDSSTQYYGPEYRHAESGCGDTESQSNAGG